jgi:hypothetical protein
MPGSDVVRNGNTGSEAIPPRPYPEESSACECARRSGEFSERFVVDGEDGVGVFVVSRYHITQSIAAVGEDLTGFIDLIFNLPVPADVLLGHDWH